MNKIAVSIILALILIVGINKLSDKLYYVEKPKKSAYQVESAVTDSSLTVEKDSGGLVSGNIIALFASTNAAEGEKVFKKCAACHSINKGGKNKIGPALYNVVGRAVGGVDDYKYSKALASYGKEWTFEELNGFLIKPSSYLKGTKMSYAGLRKEKDRASVIKYLNQNSDVPKLLP